MCRLTMEERLSLRFHEYLTWFSFMLESENHWAWSSSQRVVSEPAFSIVWRLVWNAHFSSHPRVTESETLWVGAQLSVLTSSPGDSDAHRGTQMAHLRTMGLGHWKLELSSPFNPRQSNTMSNDRVSLDFSHLQLLRWLGEVEEFVRKTQGMIGCSFREKAN